MRKCRKKRRALHWCMWKYFINCGLLFGGNWLMLQFCKYIEIILEAKGSFLGDMFKIVGWKKKNRWQLSLFESYLRRAREMAAVSQEPGRDPQHPHKSWHGSECLQPPQEPEMGGPHGLAGQPLQLKQWQTPGSVRNVSRNNVGARHDGTCLQSQYWAGSSRTGKATQRMLS